MTFQDHMKSIVPTPRRRVVQDLAMGPVDQIHPASPLMRWRVKPSGRYAAEEEKEEWLAGVDPNTPGCILFWSPRPGRWAGTGYLDETPLRVNNLRRLGGYPTAYDLTFDVEEKEGWLKAEITALMGPATPFADPNEAHLQALMERHGW